MEENKNTDPLVSMQQELCEMWGIDNQKKYVFYYDESNNCRKFWVDDSKQQFNTDFTSDFVLAGLVKKDEDVIETSLETFRKSLRLQKKDTWSLLLQDVGKINSPDADMPRRMKKPC